MMSQSTLLTSGTLPFGPSSPCRPSSRRSGTRVGVARQPPGDRDPSFSKPLPSFSLQPVNDTEEEEEEDHLTRTHHSMTACSFFAPSLSLLGKGALFRLGAAVEASGNLKKALIITESRGIQHIVEAVSRELFSAVGVVKIKEGELTTFNFYRALASVVPTFFGFFLTKNKTKIEQEVWFLQIHST